MQSQREALDLPPKQYGCLSWDVFKSHTTQAVLDLLEARFIKPVYVPANCTSLSAANDHPEFNKNVKQLNKNKFMVYYADQVAQSLERGDNEVFIHFPSAEMKPLHARWTAESLAYVATQEQWMENALRGVGLWDVLVGDFVPDPELELEFFNPPVATAQEAAEEQPSDSESEYEFVSASEDETDEEENEEGHTPIYQSPDLGQHSDSDGELVTQPTKRRRHTFFEDSDDNEEPPPNAKEEVPNKFSNSRNTHPQHFHSSQKYNPRSQRHTHPTANTPTINSTVTSFKDQCSHERNKSSTKCKAFGRGTR